jgi:hypothetical protein
MCSLAVISRRFVTGRLQPLRLPAHLRIDDQLTVTASGENARKGKPKTGFRRRRRTS